MDWNDYRDEMDRAPFDPAFRQRAMHALKAAQQGGKETTMKKTKNSLQRILIAAAVLAFAVIGTIAITASLRDSARQDMGLSQKEPSPNGRSTTALPPFPKTRRETR